MNLTGEILDQIGFTKYDDEHCTWGNRRLYFVESNTDFECMQIIQWCNYPEENGREAGYSYAGWFDNIRHDRNMANDMDLNTVDDLIEAVKLFRPELYERFLERIKSVQDLNK